MEYIFKENLYGLLSRQTSVMKKDQPSFALPPSPRQASFYLILAVHFLLINIKADAPSKIQGQDGLAARKF